VLPARAVPADQGRSRQLQSGFQEVESVVVALALSLRVMGPREGERDLTLKGAIV
jgi:hypothetical protein